MIVCRDCGHQNEEDDQFCGSCGSFLEFTGDRITPDAPVARVVEDDEPESEFLLRAKRALAVDNASVAETEATDARVVDEDAALAAQVIARRQAEEAAREAEAAAETQRQADAEAAQRLAESERAKAEADERAAQAERDLEVMRREREEEAARKANEIEAARVAAEQSLAAKVRAAEDQARADAARAQQELEQRLKDQEAAAEVARLEAAAAVRRAQEIEHAAEQERVAAQQRLEEAASAAAAAALRAGQENDALAAAEAARLSSEAEAVRSRAESAAAAAGAAEEVAKAKAEAEAARAEAAELRAKAEADAARSELERRQLAAEREAAEEAAAARRRVEEQAEADRQRALAEAEAAALKAKSEAEAAERKAEAELEARQAEAKAAQARAEEERARSAAEAEAAKREREEALRKAAALVATPKTETPAPSVKTPAASKPAAAPKAPTTPKGEGAAGESTVPEARLPGSVAARQAPKRSASAELNVGDVVCGQCGAGNTPSRKFCRKCGTSLAEAQPVKLGFFAKLRAKSNARKRRKRESAAGTRPGRNGAPGASGLNNARNKGRRAWWKLNTSILRIGALVGMLAMFGFGVEPIRSKLHLPNVRQKIFDTIRRTANPVYDPVRAVSSAASSSVKGNEAGSLIDLANNTSWLAAPTSSGGVGTSITVGFEKPFDLGRVLLTSGLAGSDDPAKGFVSQPRPSELRVIFNDDETAPVTVSVKDTEQPQTLKLDHKETTKVRFEITGVYPAANGKGKSVAITEMEFFQKRKFGDNFETLSPPKIVGAGKIGALIDDDLSTAWISADAANGVGQGFSIVFDAPTDIDRIRIAPGQAEATFQSLPRPDEVQLAFTCDGICDATKQVSFSDKPGYKSIGVKATGVTKIDVLVRSVHGTGGGVAFADLQIQRKRPTVR